MTNAAFSALEENIYDTFIFSGVVILELDSSIPIAALKEFP